MAGVKWAIYKTYDIFIDEMKYVLIKPATVAILTPGQLANVVAWWTPEGDVETAEQLEPSADGK